jgi:hypothetical protein
MSTARFYIAPLRLTPLAGCLAAALALASSSADASRVPHIRSNAAALLARAYAGDPPQKPSWWTQPDPAEIALRWQPAPHVIPPVPANSIVVQNCNDSGSGSLRDAIGSANTGDTIDLTQLSCSQITLTTGSIVFAHTTLTLQGPGSQYLSISGNDAYAALRHAGSGKLYLDDLTIEHANNDYTDTQGALARGGCIFSNGIVYLNDSVVAYCSLTNASTLHGAEGGAIFGQVGVSLSNSAVINSSVNAPSSYGLGGGIYSRGFVDLSDSFVSGNTAERAGGAVYAYSGFSAKYSTVDSNRCGYFGGGLFVSGNILIANSTISNNQAIVQYGGAALDGYGATAPITVLNSTISGNSAGVLGGTEILEYAARVVSSTIAFNYEGTASKYGAGLYVRDAAVDLESTIIANNTYAGGTAPDDVGGTATGTLTGANNLFGYSTISAPSDTILLQSPRLGPLAYHGGTTRTHMILSGSPAIDAGNNAGNASYDQRGDGYPRVIGSESDIGAFELDTNDVIFANGFDP